MTWDQFVQIAAPMIVGACLVVLFLAKLRESCPGDVRTVWYFFSLAAVVTGLGIAWGMQVQAISPVGVFTGSKAGQFLSELLHMAMDLEADMALVGAVACVLVLPQLFSYVLCGLFGCASRPWLMGPGAAFVVWSLVKFFVVFAGIAVVWGICSVALWQAPFKVLFLYLAFAVLSMTTATLLLWFYRSLEHVISWAISRFPDPVLRALKRIDALATRHLPQAGGAAAPGRQRESIGSPQR